MKDPYLTLGVPRSASPDTIKSAFRRLAKSYHPDLNHGDPGVEQKFKDVNAAYDLLRDSDKRRRYDRGEIDAAGNERRRGFRPGQYGASPYGPGAGPGAAGSAGGAGRAGGPGGFKSAFTESFDTDDLFSELFGSRRRTGSGRRAHTGPTAGADVSYSVRVKFVEAALGTRKRLTLADGKTLTVSVPPGTEDHQTLRLKGQGQPGFGGGPNGDAYIEVQIEPHALFTRKDRDIHIDLPISLQEAILGGSITVPTLDGRVQMKIPEGSSSGSVLRLKGKGIPTPDNSRRGDQYVKLKIILPAYIDGDLRLFLKNWALMHPYNPREKLDTE